MPVPQNSIDVGLAESELRHLVLAAQREGNRELAKLLAPMDLSPSQGEVIRVIADFGPLSLKRLGALIICETGSPSRLVDSLVRRGIVQREISAEDKRSVLLSLTDLGVEKNIEVSNAERTLDAYAEAMFTSEEKAVLAIAFRRFLGETASGEAIQGRFATRRSRIK